MAREPVAIDFVGLGGMRERGVGLMGSGPIECGERGSRGHLARPVPSLPDNHASDMQSMSRTLSVSEGFRNWDNRDTRLFTRPAAGIYRIPWVNNHTMAGRCEENSGMTVDLSLKKEVSEAHTLGHSPSLSALDPHLAPASPSRHNMSSSNEYEDLARKTASMYANPHQAVRNVPVRKWPVREEAYGGVHQSNLSGAEHSSMSPPHPSASHSAGFVSPVPLYSRMKGNSGVENGAPIAGQSPPDQQPQHQVQDANMEAAHALARPPATGKHLRTAQLTIFYGGTVNVFDDVPYDKAQAIMLLAGRGGTWSSSNFNNIVPGSGGASGHPATIPSASSQPTSRAGSPASQVTATSAGTPPPVSVPNPNRPTPTTKTVELPQARKASLARFLERRKDRVRKGPYTLRNDLTTRDAMMGNREKSPNPFSSRRPPTRSPSSSPSTAGNNYNASVSGASPNSPLPSPRKESTTEAASHGIITRRTGCESSKEIVEAPSGTSSPSMSKVAVAVTSTEAMDPEHSS